MTFDPAWRRKCLEEMHIKRARESQFAPALRANALESVGTSILETSIECILVGLFNSGRELLPQARSFVQGAIDRQEIPITYQAGSTEGARLMALALCDWLINGKHNQAALTLAVIEQERYRSRDKPDHTSIHWSIPDYLNAEAYETIIYRFETAKMKPPGNLRRIQGEGTMCYAIAQHRLGLKYSKEEIDDAFDTFLKRKVPIWCEGPPIWLARWMKIAFWKPGDDPIATLLKCYDYLPDLKAPMYPAD